MRSVADLTLKWKGREGGVGEPQSALQRLFKVVWESSSWRIGPSLPHKRALPQDACSALSLVHRSLWESGALVPLWQWLLEQATKALGLSAVGGLRNVS